MIFLVTGTFYSCQKDLLDQNSPNDLSSDLFWKTVDDATFALNGAYSHVRFIFDRDYLFDGHGEFSLTRNETSTSGSGLNAGSAYYKGNYTPQGYGDSFDRYYEAAYGAIHRCNYVIENVKPMLDEYPNSREELEIVIGEARLLRGMTYFRLMSMWGHIVYFDKIIYDREVGYKVERTDIRIIKQKVEEDFTFAYENLPNRAVVNGRASKWAALGFRGKLNLYWACWNRTSWPWTSEGGWPELEGFVPDPAESIASYKAARDDFKTLIDESGLTLFRNGLPGNIGSLGTADTLPNFFYLFIPRTSNESLEIVMGFAHGGTSKDQGDANVRNFGNRATEGAQIWIQPYAEIIDRFQSTVTGDYMDPVEFLSPNTVSDARTRPNSLVNPQTYANRDYRLKASMLWDKEVIMGLRNLEMVGFHRYQFKTTSGDIDGLPAVNSSQAKTGLIPRKFVTNDPGLLREEGYQKWPVMRLADIYLMFAEASNEVDGPTIEAVELVNQIRARGNLPALQASKYANKESFFDAIEQERIIELLHEGHRGFDIRRWRMMTKIWGPVQGPGVRFNDTHGTQIYEWFNNANDLEYQQQYIFRIPVDEVTLNPKMKQNTPWL
jgi:starch-binding outer membrane protein, SusD/RagB family